MFKTTTNNLNLLQRNQFKKKQKKIKDLKYLQKCKKNNVHKKSRVKFLKNIKTIQIELKTEKKIILAITTTSKTKIN